MLDFVDSYGIPTFVVLNIFFIVVFLVREGALDFIKARMSKEMPRPLRYERMAACKKSDFQVSLDLFGSSVFLAAASILFLMRRNGEMVGSSFLTTSLLTFSVVDFLIFLGIAVYAKTTSWGKIYDQALEWNQMSRFVGEMSHLATRGAWFLTLSNKEMTMDFNVNRYSFCRYYPLLKEGEVMVFFKVTNFDSHAERTIEHMVPTGYDTQAQFRTNNGTSIVTVVQK